MNQDKKVQLRLPKDVHQWLVIFSAENSRSMNGQMITLIREKMQEQIKKSGCSTKQ